MIEGRVPWSKLFPGLSPGVDIILTSAKRSDGRRCNSARVLVPHARLAEVRAKVEPYGYTAEVWWDNYLGTRSECVRCLRLDPVPAGSDGNG